jgi:hypothetical protein
MNTIDSLEKYLLALDRWLKAQSENNPLVNMPTFAEFELTGMDKEMARNFASNRLKSVGVKAELK